MRTSQSDPHLAFLLDDPSVVALADALASGRRMLAMGSSGSSSSLVAGAIAARTGRTVVLVMAHLDAADDAVDEMNSMLGAWFEGGAAAERFPAMEALPGETRASLDLFAERLNVIRRADGAGGGLAPVLVCPIQALMQTVPAQSRVSGLTLRLERGKELPPGEVVRWLDAAGYERVEAVEEPGQYAVRGGILDVFPPGGAVSARTRTDEDAASGSPLRIDFFGDEVESLALFDLETMGSLERLETAELVGASAELITADDGQEQFLSLLPRETVVLFHETMEIVEQARGYFERAHDGRGIVGPPAVLKLAQERFPGLGEVNQFSHGMFGNAERIDLPIRPLPSFATGAGDAAVELGALARARTVVATCQNEGEASRLAELLTEFAPEAQGAVRVRAGYLHRGFLFGGGEERGGFALVPNHELLHRYHTRRRVRRLRGGRATDVFVDLKPGDYVVHADHGVAKFLGLRTLRQRRLKAEQRQQEQEEGPTPGEEFLTLEFAGGAKLNVPVTQIEQVQKYVGGFKGRPPLSTLGGKRWQAQKDRTSEAVKDLAAELLRVQAARAATPGVAFPGDTAWQREFEAEFPYEETEDQLAALAEIKKDMQSARPMDRLVCGDVGYGKTELAIRAAFKAVEFGRQVAVLVPTTVLAEQHERTFRARFAAYPFRIESVSRFKTTQEQNATLAAARKGQVDVLIGTHRLLSKDVRFADLGLVIIDEEQRFGVEHKQALLALRMTVDVLTLSATPIPRTLHMAMLGLRDISSLATPPLDRRAVVTEVLPYNEKRIRTAIERELNREGQVFFVHNRVHNIRSAADEVQKLAPTARIVVGHGQMAPSELEEVMLRFTRREADILVSTTIIESGIDIPTANTMIINDADRFGLADLHQLRGRVGRHKHRAYCYLLLPLSRPITEVAKRRLKAVEEFSMLGAGFKIAMRDLEIRGAGNLLGAEQSGHIAAVGYDMYCRLLDRAVHELRNEVVADPSETTVEIGAAGGIPKTYIPSDSRRMEAYRRVARASTLDELSKVEATLREAYGEPPEPLQRMLEIAEVRIAVAPLGVRSVSIKDQDVVFRCVTPGAVVRALDRPGAPGTVRALPPRPPDTMHEVYFRPPEKFLAPATLLAVLRRRLSGVGAGKAGAPVS